MIALPTAQGLILSHWQGPWGFLQHLLHSTAPDKPKKKQVPSRNFVAVGMLECPTMSRKETIAHLLASSYVLILGGLSHSHYICEHFSWLLNAWGWQNSLSGWYLAFHIFSMQGEPTSARRLGLAVFSSLSCRLMVFQGSPMSGCTKVAGVEETLAVFHCPSNGS